MRILSLFLLLFFIGSAGSRFPIREKSSTPKINLVNPFIGTGGHGHTFPGATVPFGMVQLSPDTRLTGWDACSGYHSSDPAILGFSHTHLSGTGIGDYGDILFMPTTGAQQLRQGTSGDPGSGYCSRKAAGSETASPGYYTVKLADYDITAELTSTVRAGMHRYLFPEGKKAGVVIDIGHTLQNHFNHANRIEVINDHEIRGYKLTRGWAREQPVYFYAVFSEPFSYRFAVHETLLASSGNTVDQVGAKALLTFDSLPGKALLVKVGISAVDFEGARNNVVSEIPDWDFNGIKEAAAAAWTKWLDRIDITGGSPEQQRIFYTALYHTAISPNVFSDADGRYRGMDKKIHCMADRSRNYTVFSLWDTFRAFHPLMTIINPSMNEEWIRSFIKKYEEGGALPMWELSSNETGTMIGYHAVSVIADAYIKGNRNYDVEKAYKAMTSSRTFDTVSIQFPDKEVQRNLMPLAKYYNEANGFIPCDRENESVSKALEFAYDDWCIAQVAKGMDRTSDYEKLTERSKRYTKYFDKRIGFMRGVNADGSWKVPFNPRFSNHRVDEYVEGNSWQWSWFVPHDVQGLIALHGGEKQFALKLDSLFSAGSAIEGENSSMDISGMIGQYAHGNEPSHHIAYLYNFVGQPWKTQRLVDEILNTLYFSRENGLSGNEDCGQMSAWYLLSSMGIYQVSPGNPTYTFGRPLFDEATIHLENGKEFKFRAKNNAPANKYISKVSLNGVRLRSPFISHEDIMKGGILEFIMSPVVDDRAFQ